MIKQMTKQMTTILKVGLVFSLLLSVTFIAKQSVVEASSPDFTPLEAFIDQQMNDYMSEHHIPNAVISIVADGEVILEKGYGFTDVETMRPVEPQSTMFRMGSTSKLFTWTAVMQLVEQGKLDLHTDINTYIDFEIPAKLETMKNTVPEPITLTHLMTHTAGFEDSSETIFRLEPSDIVPFKDYVQNHVPARVFPPGEVIAYSNYGTALAGYIVEHVSGMPFAEYIEQHIYEPLGMHYSTFQQPLPAKLAPHMTGAYRYVDGEFLPAQFVYIPEAAGGMSTSASDMARFMLAYLQGGQVGEGRILQEETVQLMRNQQFTIHPELQGMAYGFMEGVFNGQRTLFHSGSTMLFDTGFYLLPDEQVGMFISYSGGNYLMHQHIFKVFLDEFYPHESEHMQWLSPEGSEERSKPFVGEYHQNRRSFTTEEKFISLLMGPIQVTWDKEGYLNVRHMGQSNRFVEAEPGVYYNISETRSPDPFGNFDKIIFEQDPLGHTILLTDGPMSFSKVPWYSTLSITVLAVAVTLLFIIVSFICRVVAGSVRLIKRRSIEQTRVAAAARWLVTIYGLLTFILVVDIALTIGVDPVYNYAKSTYGVVSAWAPITDLIPALTVVCSFALVVFTMITWIKRYWTKRGRIHYTLFTAASLVLTWIFSFWNLV